MFHHETLAALRRSTFIANTAGIEGPAIMSIGVMESVESVTLDRNEFHCEEGFYAYDVDNNDGRVRPLFY